MGKNTKNVLFDDSALSKIMGEDMEKQINRHWLKSQYNELSITDFFQDRFENDAYEWEEPHDGVWLVKKKRTEEEEEVKSTEETSKEFQLPKKRKSKTQAATPAKKKITARPEYPDTKHVAEMGAEDDNFVTPRTKKRPAEEEEHDFGEADYKNYWICRTCLQQNNPLCFNCVFCGYAPELAKTRSLQLKEARKHKSRFANSPYTAKTDEPTIDEKEGLGKCPVCEEEDEEINRFPCGYGTCVSCVHFAGKFQIWNNKQNGRDTNKLYCFDCKSLGKYDCYLTDQQTIDLVPELQEIFENCQAEEEENKKVKEDAIKALRTAFPDDDLPLFECYKCERRAHPGDARHGHHKCVDCNELTCIHCGKKWERKTCNIKTRKCQKKKFKDFTSYILECPKCGYVLIKANSETEITCPFMKCIGCHWYFCSLCLKFFKDKKSEKCKCLDVYNHKDAGSAKRRKVKDI